ncbi:hypothetical protein [Aliivibrio logei]|uniref:hypothetical protein n=1 Tax=Aliivibrio logei TaxID=688 RepID=UPI00039F22B8|nr:hypothetical protein [Aliivibrio logei]
MNFSDEVRPSLTSYLFVIAPFIALILVKGLTGKWMDIFNTSDWSIASAMIYMTSAINVRSATSKFSGDIKQSGLDFFMARTFMMAMINIVVYVVFLTTPSTTVGGVQIGLFICASLAHFKYGRAATRLSEIKE